MAKLLPTGHQAGDVAGALRAGGGDASLEAQEVEPERVGLERGARWPQVGGAHGELGQQAAQLAVVLGQALVGRVEATAQVRGGAAREVRREVLAAGSSSSRSSAPAAGSASAWARNARSARAVTSSAAPGDTARPGPAPGPSGRAEPCSRSAARPSAGPCGPAAAPAGGRARSPAPGAAGRSSHDATSDGARSSRSATTPSSSSRSALGGSVANTGRSAVDDAVLALGAAEVAARRARARRGSARTAPSARPAPRIASAPSRWTRSAGSARPAAARRAARAGAPRRPAPRAASPPGPRCRRRAPAARRGAEPRQLADLLLGQRRAHQPDRVAQPGLVQRDARRCSPRPAMTAPGLRRVRRARGRPPKRWRPLW